MRIALDIQQGRETIDSLVDVTQLIMSQFLQGEIPNNWGRLLTIMAFTGTAAVTRMALGGLWADIL